MSNKLLAAEFVVALGFSSWGALKDKQLPWPPTVVKTGLAFAILGIVATISPELAATLGGGFLLAQLIKVLENKTPYTGGAPKNLGDGKGEIPDAFGPGKQGHPGILTFG